MNSSRSTPFPSALNITRHFVVMICLAYALFGLSAHDPWKTPDAVNIAIAAGFSSGQTTETAAIASPDWLIPRLAGDPWLQSPPLYHWLAAKTGDVLSPWLPWHAGARSVSALLSLTGLFFLSLAARGFHGREAAYIAPLLAIGSLGLLVPAHDAQPALIGFASLAAVMAALAWWEVRPGKAAAGMGFAIGLGFLGTGADSLLVNLAVVFTALAFPTWRRVSRSSWILALLVAAVLIAVWPLALFRAHPILFEQWWSGELRRAFNFDVRRIEFLFWGTWPVLPFAFWGLWLHRRQVVIGRHFIPLAATLAALLLYFSLDDPNDAMLPLIAALSIPASAGVGRLRRGAASAFDWFGSITITLFLGLVWLGGIAILTGQPARVAKNFTRPAPDFVPEFSWLALVCAVMATLVWMYVLVVSPRSPWRGMVRWGTGIACIWVTLVCLWMPWVDHGKSYRQVVATLKKEIESAPGCIERINIGAGTRASLDYLGGIRTLPAGTTACPYRLVQADPGSPSALPGWLLLKESFRAGDRRERLRLYRRNPIR